MRLFLKHAQDPVCVHRALKVSVVVGTILGIINHYDAIFFGPFTMTDAFQMALTYVVPFMVATYGSAMQARHIELACGDAGGDGKRGEMSSVSGDGTKRIAGAGKKGK